MKQKADTGDNFPILVFESVKPVGKTIQKNSKDFNNTPHEKTKQISTQSTSRMIKKRI